MLEQLCPNDLICMNPVCVFFQSLNWLIIKIWIIAEAQKKCSIFAFQTQALGIFLNVWQLHPSKKPFLLHHRGCHWEKAVLDPDRVAPLLCSLPSWPTIFAWGSCAAHTDEGRSAQQEELEITTTRLPLLMSQWMQVLSVIAVNSDEPFDCTQLQIFSAVTSRNRNYEDQSGPSWVSNPYSKAGWSLVLRSL